jgi:hypothetical protein
MRRIVTLAALSFGLGVFTAPAARADIIAQGLAGTETASPGFIGQSLVTPAGGPWHNIAINFTDGPATMPNATGTVFLLNQEYLGMPASLGSSTQGVLAASTGRVAGQYAFAPGFTVQPNATYWVYEKNSLGSISGETILLGTNRYYFTNAKNINSEGEPGNAIVTLSGNVVTTPVPAPPAVVLVGLGAGCVAVRRYVGRRATV